MKNIKKSHLFLGIIAIASVGIYLWNKRDSKTSSKESQYSNFVGKSGEIQQKSKPQTKKLCQVRNSDGSTTMYSPNYNGKTPCWRGGTLTQSKNSVKHAISL